jgi:hypothetical protein
LFKTFPAIIVIRATTTTMSSWESFLPEERHPNISSAEPDVQTPARIEKRCILEYNWIEGNARRVSKAYRQWMYLKVAVDDYDAYILSPSVDMGYYWHQHILVCGDYYRWCLMYCGRLIGCNPDEMKPKTEEERSELTKRSLRTAEELMSRFRDEKLDLEV